MGDLSGQKREKFPMNLFCSLMLLSFVPFLYMLVRKKLIVSIPSTDGLGIGGHCFIPLLDPFFAQYHGDRMI